MQTLPSFVPRIDSFTWLVHVQPARGSKTKGRIEWRQHGFEPTPPFPNIDQVDADSKAKQGLQVPLLWCVMYDVLSFAPAGWCNRFLSLAPVLFELRPTSLCYATLRYPLAGAPESGLLLTALSQPSFSVRCNRLDSSLTISSGCPHTMRKPRTRSAMSMRKEGILSTLSSHDFL